MNYKDTGHQTSVTPALPASWSHTTLGDVCLDPQYGWTTSASRNGNLPLIRTTDISSGSIDWHSVPYCDVIPADIQKYILHDGDILISRAGSVGTSFLIRKPRRSVFASYLIRFRPLVDERYINYFLQTHAYWNQISESTSGIAIPNVNANKLRQVRLPLAPVTEQVRIADKIDELFSELDAGVASLKRARALLKRYRQAVLKAAVTGELTRDWRARHGGQIKESGAELLQRILKARRQAWEAAELKKLRVKGKPPKDERWKQNYKEPQQPDTTALPALPEGWVRGSTDQLMSHVTSGSRAWSKYYGSGSGTFILAQNVRPGRLDLSVRQSVNPPQRDPERVRTEVQQHDVLVTIVGANTGDVCRVDGSLTEHYVCQSVALLRPVMPEMSRFIMLYLTAEGGGQDQYQRYIYGAGRPHLSFDQLRMTAISVPTLDEQSTIVDLVDDYFYVFDFLEGAIQIELRRADFLRQAILKAAFAGKLVPQDQGDEPASVLLGRIRAERAARPKPTRGRRHKTEASAQQLALPAR